MAVGNGYSSAQILSMQKDAIRRVNEMQRLSQERLRKTQESLGETPAPLEAAPEKEAQPLHLPDHRMNQRSSGGHSSPSRVHREEEPKQPASEPPEPETVPAAVMEYSPESPFKGILQRLNLDQETILVLLLLLMLVNEGADSKLIMALVYILI